MTKPPIGTKSERAELRRLYIHRSMSVREIAEFLGCTKDMVFRAFKEYGIETRTNKRRSSLKDIKLSVIEKGIGKKGIIGYARELRVDESTLRHHLKNRRIAG